MIKIQFLLKEITSGQENLEYITISEPRVDKNQKFPWGHPYFCDIYLSNIGKTLQIHSVNPIDALFQATETTRDYLKALVASNVISEVETKKPWLLEKLSDNHLQNKIEKIKNDPDMSQEDKQKILGIVKESFGKIPHMKDELKNI